MDRTTKRDLSDVIQSSCVLYDEEFGQGLQTKDDLMGLGNRSRGVSRRKESLK